MRKIGQKIVSGILGVLICVSLSGCTTVGGYVVFDYYSDENGDNHFMLFGERGENGGEEESENADSEKVDDVQESGSNYNPESIVGISLKRGWTSSDHSILRGSGVSVKEDSILFAIDLEQEKEIIIFYDIVLDDGEYQLVYISPDGTEQILQDSQTIRSEEKIVFTQGKNEIAVLSDHAEFKDIDISVTGIDVSDFK